MAPRDTALKDTAPEDTDALVPDLAALDALLSEPPDLEALLDWDSLPALVQLPGRVPPSD